MPRADRDELPTASWFHEADKSLLYFYGGHIDGPFLCPPTPVAENISIHETHARNRVRTLTEAGMLEQQNTSYRITSLGRRYVEGRVDKAELESLAPMDG